MRLIGWAIALAAAGLTPAAAPGASSRAQPQRRDAPAATPPAGDRAERDQARRRRSRRSSPAASATRSRRRASASPTAARASRSRSRRSARKPPRFHNNWLLLLCAVISVFVLALLLYAMVRFRRGANPTPSRNSHNTLIEVDLDAGPGADPGRDRDPVDPAAAPPIHAAAGRPDGQGHRPPMVLVATNYPDYGVSFDSYMLKEANDPTRQAEPARPHRRRRPAAARGRRAAGHSRRQGGEVHHHRRRRDPQLRRARPSGSSRTPTPASSTRPGPRSTGRASISANARSCAARATASCRSPSKSSRRRSSPHGSRRRAAPCPAPSRRLPRRRRAGCAPTSAAAAAPARRRRRQPTARDQPGRDRAELRAERELNEHHRRRPPPEAARSA